MRGFRGLLTVLTVAAASAAADGDWPHWRGPNDDGMARGDAPLLYLASENDDVIVARLGEKFEVLATNTLKDQMFIGTPAILDGEIYLRGQNTLFCIR
jgi:hypothetical protein